MLPPNTATALQTHRSSRNPGIGKPCCLPSPGVLAEDGLRRAISEPQPINLEDFENRLDKIREMAFDASRKGFTRKLISRTSTPTEKTRLDRPAQTGVKLSTIHAAKGLEFKVVFVVALEEGILPHHRSMTQKRVGEDHAYDAGLEEERRLMYVAMTRASDHLHLTRAVFRRNEYMEPSRFLQELPQALMDQSGADGE